MYIGIAVVIKEWLMGWEVLGIVMVMAVIIALLAIGAPKAIELVFELVFDVLGAVFSSRD